MIDENNSAFYLCGETYGNNANSNDMSVVKVDQSGSFVWDVHYNGTASGSIDGIRSATIDSIGNIYVTGFSQEATGGQDYTTIMYDGSGNQIWKIHYQGGYCQANAICLDYNNDVIITGFTTPSMASSQFRTVKYSTATGITTNNRNFSNVKVFPNPTNGIFIIEGNNIQRIEIKNVNGINGGDIKDVTTNKKQLEIDLSQYPKGIYLIKVLTDKGVAAKKVVLE